MPTDLFNPSPSATAIANRQKFKNNWGHLALMSIIVPLVTLLSLNWRLLPVFASLELAMFVIHVAMNHAATHPLRVFLSTRNRTFATFSAVFIVIIFDASFLILFEDPAVMFGSYMLGVAQAIFSAMLYAHIHMSADADDDDWILIGTGYFVAGAVAFLGATFIWS